MGWILARAYGRSRPFGLGLGTGALTVVVCAAWMVIHVTRTVSHTLEALQVEGVGGGIAILSTFAISIVVARLVFNEEKRRLLRSQREQE